MKKLERVAETIWSGRKVIDTDLPQYWYQVIQQIDLENLFEDDKKIALVGYCCEEGVRRNLGRVGAKDAPNLIREMLAKTPYHFDNQLVDLGNVICENDDLEAAQAHLANTVSAILAKNHFPVILGGGHDIAYGHYKGIKKQYPNAKVGIINFDAHFDLRPIESQPNSGTPFNQISKEYEDFHYLCIGIQKEGNTPSLYKIADELGVQYISNTELFEKSNEEIAAQIEQFADQVDYIYLTIDMDGFSASHAPGVSAPSSFGFYPKMALSWIKTIVKTDKLISFDVAELNPTYDIDNRTAKLTARLINYILMGIFG